MTNLKLEIKSGIEFLKKLDRKKVFNFASQIKPPVLVAGMGSSYYLPAGRAQSIANKLGSHPDISFIFASEGYNINPKYWNTLVLISNSGETREVTELAKKFPREKIYAITSSKNSKLAKRAGKIYVLQSGKEKAVAATKSIIEQSIICENIVRLLAGEKILEKSDLGPVAKAMRANLKKKISHKLLVQISGARTVYFIGGYSGIGEEISLKFTELAKKKSKFVPGTQILHGLEEVIEKGDAVFLLFAERYKKYLDRFRMMKTKTGCYLYFVGSHNSISDIELDLELAKGFKPYCILAYFWNILTEFALLKGYSLDKGEKISKVGVGTKT